MSLAFLITTLIVVASPGTGVIYTLAAGLSRGPRAGIVAAFSCTLGILPHMAAAMLGLATLLHTSAVAFEMVKYAGVAYLIYMAWQTLRERGALRVDQRARPPSVARVMRDGILLNILNPKLSIFFVAFLPQFMARQDANPLWRMAELSLVFMAVTFVVFVLYGAFAGLMRSHVLARPRVMASLRMSFAAAFGALAAKLALAER